MIIVHNSRDEPQPIFLHIFVFVLNKQRIGLAKIRIFLTFIVLSIDIEDNWKILYNNFNKFLFLTK